MLQFYDALTLDNSKTRTTGDGYVVASALTARTGVQTYTAKELGLTDRAPNSIVRLYRPPEAVFNTDALATMAFRPITIDHPTERVTKDNWSQLAKGHTGADVLRDGERVRMDLMLTDAAIIDAFNAGKRELSWGYTADVILQDGIVPEGEQDAGQPFDAIQDGIKCNHLALCDRARGGKELRIGDQQTEPKTGEPKVKIILVDGLQVEVTDAAEAAINKLSGQIVTLTADAATAAAASAATIAAHVQTIADQAGEIVVLKAAVTDAAVTPAKMAEAVAARSKLVGQAKPILGDGFKFDDADDDAIRSAVVIARLGDAAKDMDAAHIGGAFRAIVATVSDGATDGIRAVMLDGQPVNLGDAKAKAEAARKAMADEMIARSNATAAA